MRKKPSRAFPAFNNLTVTEGLGHLRNDRISLEHVHRLNAVSIIGTIPRAYTEIKVSERASFIATKKASHGLD